MSISITRTVTRPNLSVDFYIDINDSAASIESMPVLSRTRAKTREFINSGNITLTETISENQLVLTSTLTYNSFETLNTRLATDPAPHSVALGIEAAQQITNLGNSYGELLSGIDQPFTITYTFSTTTGSLDSIGQYLATLNENQTQIVINKELSLVTVTYTYNNADEYNRSNSASLPIKLSRLLSTMPDLVKTDVWALV